MERPLNPLDLIVNPAKNLFRVHLADLIVRQHFQIRPPPRLEAVIEHIPLEHITRWQVQIPRH